MSKKIELEPIDLYGNWKVTKLQFQPPAKPFGLKKGASKFKIKNKASKHVLIKKKSVGWNGAKTEIPLQEVTSSEPVLFNANLRLKAIIKFKGVRYEVSFGSDDNGVSLKIQIVPVDYLAGIPGGTGTAGRGG
jgi:hypothetical protein